MSAVNNCCICVHTLDINTSAQPCPLKYGVHDSEKSLKFNRKEPSLSFLLLNSCQTKGRIAAAFLCQWVKTDFVPRGQPRNLPWIKTESWAMCTEPDYQASWPHRTSFYTVYIYQPVHHVEAFGSTGPLHPCSAVCRSLLKPAAFPVVKVLGNRSCNISWVTGS